MQLTERLESTGIKERLAAIVSRFMQRRLRPAARIYIG